MCCEELWTINKLISWGIKIECLGVLNWHGENDVVWENYVYKVFMKYATTLESVINFSLDFHFKNIYVHVHVNLFFISETKIVLVTMISSELV